MIAVLDDDFTKPSRWDDPTSPYRAARSQFLSIVGADPLANLPRKRTRQLKSTLHLYFGVVPPKGFTIDADVYDLQQAA